jgi:glycosyltransferase involved in cell wall biosynthesis
MKSSVLIPSYGRPAALERCLAGIYAQTAPPGEVIVVWQGNDDATRLTVERVASAAPIPTAAVHSPEVGVVPAENAALEAATGDVVLLIDDDAVPPPDWVERHLRHYEDPRIGAVGGPAVNHRPDGTPYPARSVEPIGHLTWYGKTIGNMYDHPPAWRSRPSIFVDHLVGYNLSFLRDALDRFETGLRPYWQHFELDACLAVQRRGFHVMFDFANVVDHWPTNPAYAGGRDGNLQIKIYNAAYNQAFVLAKHSPPGLRLARLAYLLLIGSVTVPGVAGAAAGALRFGSPLREARILSRTLAHRVQGWRAGRLRRSGA